MQTFKTLFFAIHPFLNIWKNQHLWIFVSHGSKITRNCFLLKIKSSEKKLWINYFSSDNWILSDFFKNHQNCKFTFLVLESEVTVYFAMSSLSHRAGEIYVSVQKYEKAIFGFFSDSFRTPISDVSRTYFRLLFFNDFMIFLLLFSSSSRLSSKKPIMNCQCERVNI